VPFGALPVLQSPDKPLLAQSNAILVFIGRQHPGVLDWLVKTAA
jgi:glutathione S-transferase